MTVAEELRSVVSARTPAYYDVQQLINLINGRNFGAPVKLIGYDSASTFSATVQNQNNGATAPSINNLDNAGAIILQTTKAGVTLGKATTIYPSLTVKDGAAGTTNLAVTSTGVVTRPLLKNWNGATTYMQSDSTELVVNPQARVTNGTIDYLKANSTEVLTRAVLRNWNGTIDYLKSDSTELLVRPAARVWDGTTVFLDVSSGGTLAKISNASVYALRSQNANAAGFTFQALDSASANQLSIAGTNAAPLVSVGAAKLWYTPLIGVASANLTLTNSYQDITGATVTLTGIGWWKITGVVYLFNNGDGGNALEGQLVVSGGTSTTSNSTSIIAGPRTTGDAQTHSQVWLVNVTAGTPAAKLQAKKAAGAGGSLAIATSTVITAEYLGNGTT